MKILVVEDERLIAQALKEGLEQEGFAVDAEYDGEAGLLSAQASEYDLIIMDIMMPIMSGVEVCKQLRAEGNHTPILMLTAKSQNSDIVDGLETGADDYLTKPFAFDVLLARIRALLRRPKTTLGQTLVYADLELNPSTKTATRGQKNINLSQKEFAILEFLMRHPEQILSKNKIIEHVWDFDADVLPNNVESFIKLLRAKIDKPFKKPLIHTVRGFGYKISQKP